MSWRRNFRQVCFRIGLQAGRKMEAGGIRFYSLALSTFLIVVVGALISSMIAVSMERENRARNGVPDYAGNDTPNSEIVVVKTRFDNLEDSRQFEVHYFTPLGANAPLPPGLDRWPEPGEVYLSPALLERGNDEKISARYGDFSGIISSDGLIDRGELLAYVRPEIDLQPDDRSIDKVVGWGSTEDLGDVTGIHWLAMSHDLSVPGLVAFVVAALVLPALSLALVSARIAASRRDRREGLVAMIGGRRKHLRWIAAGESFPPMGIGFGVAAALIAYTATKGATVPIVDFVVRPQDLQSHLPMISFATVLSFGAAFGIVIGLARRLKTRKDSSRPLTDRRMRKASIVASLFPVSLAIGVFLPQFFAYTPGYMIFQWVGTVGVLLTLPATLGLLTARVGVLLARRGRIKHDAVLLVAGSHLQAQPREIARYITGLAMGLVLFFLISAYQGILAGDSEEAMQYREHFETNTVLVHTPDAVSLDILQVFASEFQDPVEVLALKPADGFNSVNLVSGSCETLRQVDLPCDTETEEAVDSGRVDSLISAWISGPISVKTQDPSEAVLDGSTFLLVNPDRTQIDIPGVKLAGGAFDEIVAIDTPGRSWLIGSMANYEQSRWVLLFGFAGLAVLGAVTTVASAGRFFDASSRLAPLTAIAGASSRLSRVAFWLVTIPICLTAVVGALTGIWVVRPLTLYATNTPGWRIAGIAAMTVLISGLPMWYWAARIAVRKSERWRPGSEE